MVDEAYDCILFGIIPLMMAEGCRIGEPTSYAYDYT
jgi:hypothetical protein